MNGARGPSRFCALFAIAVMSVCVSVRGGVAPMNDAFEGAELRLRKGGERLSFVPKIAEEPLADVRGVRPPPIARTASLADAQAAVLNDPRAWRNWAALAVAHYAAGHYEKAWASSQQMREAAIARNDAPSLEANELFEKCRLANVALSLLE